MRSSRQSTEDQDDRAVSPVIGVILMVAITVILAAVIAAFVLDLGQSQSASAAAGVDFTENGDEVTAQLVQIDRADNIYVRATDNNGDTRWIGPDDQEVDKSSRNAWSVGNSVTVDTSSPGSGDLSGWSGSGGTIESITVIGDLDNQDTVIQSWD
ncbi:type IV pilin [Natrinema salinisoli]|uniref:type IV pilin n=1 Tax=Natrinema salinisoli TaxID=2878535 RepID=UPI001CF0B321|nr:type IV pilin N-terminal domain-containing protein [Natrinema salinisoli]